MKIRSLAALLAACAMFGLAYDARADSQSEAKDLFSHARELRKAGDCGQAVPLFSVKLGYVLCAVALGALGAAGIVARELLADGRRAATR